MTDNASKLITKYALILSIFYIFSYAFNRLLPEVDLNNDFYWQAMVKGNAPWLFNLILNIFTAIILRADVNKHNVNVKYLTLATLLYRPIGVFAFLLFYILGDKANNK